MTFTPHLAERRFGYGLSPRQAGPESVAAMLDTLAGPDRIAQDFPVQSYRALQDALVLRRRFRGFARKNPQTDKGKEADQKQRAIYGEMQAEWRRGFLQLQARRSLTPDAFRERLVAFWGDHFTARGKGGMLRFGMTAYVEEAIRPQITGSFADLLIRCVTHPLMLHYLDQDSSVGPNSIMVRRRDLDRGLNENLAREVLELHTLGVDGPYSQNDVRELAELFTGLSRSRDYTFVFRRQIAEPGPETILGKTYGAGASMQYVEAALRDLAAHPATAKHIARKLAVHFISDAPPEDLVAALERAYIDSDGKLMQLYQVLLEHPGAWMPELRNIRPPDEFISAALRALGVTGDDLARLKNRDVRDLFFRPLTLMGQSWQEPPGPDGWAEEDAVWVTPQGMAARLEWAMHVPQRLLEELPKPAGFVETALGGDAPSEVRFAASAAESRAVGVGLVLCAPAYQRR